VLYLYPGGRGGTITSLEISIVGGWQFLSTPLSLMSFAFGEVRYVDPTITAIALISTICFLAISEYLMDALEEYLQHSQVYLSMIKKIYRELMIMGTLSSPYLTTYPSSLHLAHFMFSGPLLSFFLSQVSSLSHLSCTKLHNLILLHKFKNGFLSLTMLDMFFFSMHSFLFFMLSPSSFGQFVPLFLMVFFMILLLLMSLILLINLKNKLFFVIFMNQIIILSFLFHDKLLNSKSFIFSSEMLLVYQMIFLLELILGNVLNVILCELFIFLSPHGLS
jgi:hypothetical protein